MHLFLHFSPIKVLRHEVDDLFNRDSSVGKQTKHFLMVLFLVYMDSSNKISCEWGFFMVKLNDKDCCLYKENMVKFQSM